MSKMISVSEGFQYSVNIEYDLSNDGKLKNFIPTKEILFDLRWATSIILAEDSKKIFPKKIFFSLELLILCSFSKLVTSSRL